MRLQMWPLLKPYFYTHGIPALDVELKKSWTDQNKSDTEKLEIS